MYTAIKPSVEKRLKNVSTAKTCSLLSVGTFGTSANLIPNSLMFF